MTSEHVFVMSRILTANLYVRQVIQLLVLSLTNNIQEDVYEQENVGHLTVFVTQHSLQSVDMFFNIAPFGIIGRQLQLHPHPVLNVSVLTDQVLET